MFNKYSLRFRKLSDYRRWAAGSVAMVIGIAIGAATNRIGIGIAFGAAAGAVLDVAVGVLLEVREHQRPGN